MKTDVAVIGGGAAGLAAAGELGARGLHTIVLEGRDRLGGRILTRREAGLAFPIELGAEFIHGEAVDTFALADAALLPVDELPDDHFLLRGGAFQRIADFWGDIDRIRARIRGRDRSFADFIASRRSISPRLRRTALDFVRGYHAADPEKISALALAAGDEESRSTAQNRQYRIVSGYASLVDALRAACGAGVEIRLSTIVRGISWKRGEATIQTASPTGDDLDPLTARAVVLAVPSAVLKARGEAPAAITFDPPLEALDRDLARIETGHVVKLILRFRERFWDDEGWLRARTRRGGKQPPLQFLHVPDEVLPTWWTSVPARSPILTGWCGGPAALALSAEGDAAIADRAIDALARALRERRRTLEGLLDGVSYHDWSGDPFSRGAYSYVAVGGLAAQKRLARPVERTLFVAGEATSADETGTVSGAIATGRRAASQVIRALATP